MHALVRGLAALMLSFPCVTLAATPSAPVHVQARGDVIFSNGFEAAPNILLVIMDDVGIDQMAPFGYGGPSAPAVPSINALASGGLRFRNAWAMPECSPTRAALFTGRFPLRDNIYQAIGGNDLANSHVSPYEVTAPKLLRAAGYESALFGKFHLGGPENNPFGNGLPAQLGFDWFEGWIGGLPASIDTTAGGVGADDTFACGFVPDTARDPANGADSGACYTPDSSGGTQCAVIAGTNAADDSPGLQCLTRGGILVPNATCQATPPANLAWDRENAYYVSPMVLNHDGIVEELDLHDPRGRGYRSTLEVDAAVRWINARAGSAHPWMATVAFSSAHTPFQQPPGALLPSGAASIHAANCNAPADRQPLFNSMIESMDTELGRLLVETGLATRGTNDEVIYDPAASNTLIVVIGDNGSFAPTVKAPFDPMRAKGSAYQTGVWVPMTVSGARVVGPGRNIEHAVNVTDLFRLFGEVAGVDVDGAVPRVVDGESMLPYLGHTTQPAIREFNFTEGGLNLQANGARNGPCVIGNQCTHTPMSKEICEDNGGTWWGVGAEPPVPAGGVTHCWQVNQVIYHDNPAQYEQNKLVMGAITYRAVRNEQYKLVLNEALDYDPALDTGVEADSVELYPIDQAIPPQLDRAANDVLADGKLTPPEAINYVRLMDVFEATLASKIPCPGDGNDDGRIDAMDIADYDAIVAGGYGGSSWYDTNLDGLTDTTDRAVIEANAGSTCWIENP
jgi:arylsulfatase A-like enzyme